ncbi:hypothetical protein DYB30_010722 [Aphanomyces astaci]|uniref:Uncharacterized protein n=3 Tax=Aphanomyces astaci TaxID=112090 RepID=A0A397CFP6_APHAT|nr:hypothetical protein DYB38_007135 [Aphanomyces astaci]RHY50602.1 hypothetical protein DYB30_010722 [Aphanomyces astaci]
MHLEGITHNRISQMKFMLLVVLLAGIASVYGDSFSLSACFGLMSQPANATSSSVACLQRLDGAIKVVQYNGTHLDLRNQNITSVMSVPRGLISM